MIDNDKIANKTCNGNCSRCGNCCSLFVPFNDEDVKIIKDYVKEHNIKPKNRLNRVKNVFEIQCCFYDKKEKKCIIYPVRPYACRDFMCNRGNWKERRTEYEKEAKYNSTINKKILATFDDKIYEDYIPILLFITSLCKNSNNIVDEKKMEKILEDINRLDLLEYFNLIKLKLNK